MNKVLKEISLSKGTTLQIVHGDLTLETTDAIVNAANKRLQHGGGVAGKISKQGGPVIQEESNAWVRKHGHVQYAHPAWTSAGQLPAKYVIHAVGPVWGEGDEETKLAAAVQGALRVADELGLKSLALPAISTGIFGFPIDRAAKVILKALEAYFNGNYPSGLLLIRLVLFDQTSVSAFLES